MTYSEVVSLLSSHMVPSDANNTSQVPMLEKFVILENDRDGQSVDEDFDRDSHQVNHIDEWNLRIKF